jgi:hypothetical protein
MGDIEGWTRELLRLPENAPVIVRATSQHTVIVAPDGREVRFDVPPEALSWAHLAKAFLHLGPSCTEPHA